MPIDVSDMCTVYSRQAGILAQEVTNKYPITIVGVGHVGSTLALMLGKCGAFVDNKLTVIDPDKVGMENLSMQFFTRAQAAQNAPKVTATVNNIRDFCVADDIVAHEGKLTDEMTKAFEGIVISAVDSMAVRKQIFDATENPKVKLFIDVRTAGEYVSLFSIRPQVASDRELYMAKWFPDESADQSPCTERGVSYTSFGIVAAVGQALAAFWRGEKYPLFWEWDMRNNVTDQITDRTVAQDPLAPAHYAPKKISGVSAMLANLAALSTPTK